jgi:hypothetical protein
MNKIKAGLMVVTGMFAATAAIAVGAGASSAKSAAKGKADSGTSYFADDLSCGADMCAAGYTVDKLFGDIATTYKIKATPNKVGTINVTAKPVTFYTSTGSLTGAATATLTIGAKSAATITKGKLDLTKGTGGQLGHSFIGTFTGSGNVSTGFYKFVYKGTYK